MNTEPSIETVMAADVLREMLDSGQELVPYETISNAIGKDAQTDGYSHVYSARRIVENERKCVFVIVPRIGIKVAKPTEVINVMGSGLEHGKRTYRRVMRRGITLAPIEKQESLTPEGKSLYMNRLHRAAIHLHFDSPGSVKKLKAIMAKNDIAGVPAPKELISQLITDQPRKKRAVNDTPAHIEVPGS